MPSPILFQNEDRVCEPLRIKTSMMNPAARSRAISSPIAFLLSSLKRRRNCFTDFSFGSVFRWCSASSLGTLGMSEGFHAKMSRFSWRNSMSALSYLSDNPAPMMNCWVESPWTNSTFFVSSAGWNLGLFSRVGFFKIVESVGSTFSLYADKSSLAHADSANLTCCWSHYVALDRLPSTLIGP